MKRALDKLREIAKSGRIQWGEPKDVFCPISPGGQKVISDIADEVESFMDNKIAAPVDADGVVWSGSEACFALADGDGTRFYMDGLFFNGSDWFVLHSGQADEYGNVLPQITPVQFCKHVELNQVELALMHFKDDILNNPDINIERDSSELITRYAESIYDSVRQELASNSASGVEIHQHAHVDANGNVAEHTH